MKKGSFAFFLIGAIFFVFSIVNILMILTGNGSTSDLSRWGIGLVIGIVLIVIGVLRVRKNRSAAKPAQVPASSPVSVASAPPKKGPSVIPAASIDIYTEYFLSADYIARMRGRFVAFDLETTGLSTVSDRMIEISAVVFEGFQPVRTFSSLIHATVPISPQASRINGITDADIADAPSEAEVMRRFLDFAGPDLLSRGVVLVAHNIKFDAAILVHALERCGISGQIEVQDTLALSRRLVPDSENHKLTTLAKHFGITLEHAHRATADAIVCGRLYCSLLDRRTAQLQDALNGLSDPERAACEWVKAAVSSAGIPTDYLTFHSANYLSVKCGARTAIKFRFSARQTFVLVSDQIHIPDGLETIPAIKSEGPGLVRVIFRDLSELDPLIPFFCQRFQHVLDDALSDPIGLKQVLEPSYQHVSV